MLVFSTFQTLCSLVMCFPCYFFLFGLLSGWGTAAFVGYTRWGHLRMYIVATYSMLVPGKNERPSRVCIRVYLSMLAAVFPRIGCLRVFHRDSSKPKLFDSPFEGQARMPAASGGRQISDVPTVPQVLLHVSASSTHRAPLPTPVLHPTPSILSLVIESKTTM